MAKEKGLILKLYIASLYTNDLGASGRQFSRMLEGEQQQRLAAKHILDSYHYIHKKTAVEKIRRDGEKVFLDSGAFSAYSKGVVVDIDKYCDYIIENDDIIKKEDGSLLASVLDSIGDPLKTYQNQLYMESRGVRPLPCFHYGDDERYLEWYAANYDYITIGGMVPISTPQLKVWLDRIWEKYLVDGAGRPKLKVHGFGLTTVSLMQRYPWYSVDSSSWVQSARTGGVILLPSGKVVRVARDSPSRKIEGQHIDTLVPEHRAALEKYFLECGTDLDRLQDAYVARYAYNIWAYVQLGEYYINQSNSFTREQQELF